MPKIIFKCHERDGYNGNVQRGMNEKKTGNNERLFEVYARTGNKIWSRTLFMSWQAIPKEPLTL
jgi:hypothetical protein